MTKCVRDLRNYVLTRLRRNDKPKQPKSGTKLGYSTERYDSAKQAIETRNATKVTSHIKKNCKAFEATKAKPSKTKQKENEENRMETRSFRNLEKGIRAKRGKKFGRCIPRRGQSKRLGVEKTWGRKD